ncbi:MAG: hypothetical protein WA063_06740 [Minisyncoccia bacterium]
MSNAENARAVCQGGAFNGAIDIGEDCDGALLGGATCNTEGYSGGGGNPSCNANCTFNYAPCCADTDPIVTILPASQTGAEGSVKTYALTVKNNDSDNAVCANPNRTFTLTLTGLPACVPVGWYDTLEADTGSLAPQAIYAKNVDIASCVGAFVIPSSFTFMITVAEGANSENDSADYNINATSAEICDNSPGPPIDDDLDGDTDCADSNCFGDPACCGDGTKETYETCDDDGDCGFLEQCVGCGSCVSTVSDGACPIGYDDCDCNSATGVDGCEANLLTNRDNCGVCGNVCPWGCENGACLEPTGGLVPCGRIADNPDTIWNEVESCNLCHVVPLANNIIDYLVGLVGVITVLFIAIGGLMSVTSLGGSNGLTTAKLAISKSVLGFVFVLVAWVIVNLFMVVFGFIDPMGDGSWRKINCNISTTPENTTFCGDGIVQEAGNGDGVIEKCEQKESKVSFIARKILSHPECVNGAGGCPTGCWAAIDSDCVGVSQEEAWVKSVYSCNPATCDEGCAGDVTAPSFADIGLGCYMDDGDPLTSDCQKGKYVCNSALDEVTCEDVFSDVNYKIAGFSCQPQYDYCCQGAFALLGSMSYDIVRGSGAFYCDNICKKLGKICIGVGMDTVVCSYTVHNNGWSCANLGNTASATCQSWFSAGSGFCGDGGDSMGYGDTKCYCK